MPKFFGEMKEASLESLSSDPSASTQGRIWYDSAEDKIKLDNGSNKRALLRNDANLHIGNSGTAADNLRLNRAALGVLQLLLASNVTAEGSLATSLMGQLSARLENYTDAGKPAPGNPGRIIFVTDLLEIQFDTGATWLSTSGISGGWGALGVTVLNSNTILTSGDNKRILFADSTAGSFNIQLPAPSSNFLLTIKDYLGAFQDFPVTLTRSGAGVEIEGLASDYELSAAYGAWNLVCDGTDYFFA